MVLDIPKQEVDAEIDIEAWQGHTIDASKSVNTILVNSKTLPQVSGIYQRAPGGHFVTLASLATLQMNHDDLVGWREKATELLRLIYCTTEENAEEGLKNAHRAIARLMGWKR